MSNYDSLLDEVRSYLDRFCAFPSEAALDVVTLWVAHTHAVDATHKMVFESTPRLAILSSEPGSGKTRVLELVEQLSHNGTRVTDPTGPGLLCLIDQERATVCIDEIDVLFGPGSGQRQIRAILNSGYRRGANIVRQRGNQSSLVDTFAPIAIAGMGQNFTSNTELRPLYTRSIIVKMRKKGTDVHIDPYRERMHGPIGANLNACLASWGASHALELATAWPTMPDGVTDRLVDVWEPLVAVGETVGPEWGKRAHTACRAMALSDVDTAAHLSPTEQILTDLARVWCGETQLPTATIIERLGMLPGNKWGKAWPTPQTASKELASLLRPINVTPVKVWVDERSLQGYKLCDLVDHLPALPEESEEVPFH